MGGKGTVCVTGASGFVGSWLVMRLLEQGYTVKATEACTTVRLPSPSAELCFNSKSCKLAHDLENMKKVKHLLDLPDAGTRLTLWKADLMDEGSFDEAIHGCVGVFHVATPMDFETKDPENEVIKPCVNGLLNILQSCVKADTVRRVVFTSSAGAVTMQRHRKSAYTEDDWSDVDFCREVKMTGWMYFTSKTLAEQASFEFAKKHNLDFISIVPTLVVGEFIMPTMPPSMLTALALITRNAPHYFILNPIQFVHLDDLCLAHIFLFENPEAKGRYICSSHDITIEGLANMLSKKFPEYDIPTEFEGIDKISDTVHFSSKKLTDLGFEFKYSLEDMYEGAIKSCREKGLLPFATKKGYTKGNK